MKQTIKTILLKILWFFIGIILVILCAAVIQFILPEGNRFLELFGKLILFIINGGIAVFASFILSAIITEMISEILKLSRFPISESTKKVMVYVSFIILLMTVILSIIIY